MKRYIVFVFIVALLGGCGQKDTGGIVADGRIELNEIQVATKVAGKIVKLMVAEGDHLKKGQELGYLDLYDKTKKDLQRAQDLYKEGALPEDKVEDAQIAFNNQIIVSPIDGVVLLKIRYEGEAVLPAQPILSVGDLKNVYAKVFIQEKDIETISLGQHIMIATDAFPNKKYQGTITYIAETAEFTPKNVQTKEERTRRVYGVKISINNDNETLKPGMPCEATIEISNSSQ